MNEKKKTMRAVIEIMIAVFIIVAVYFLIRGMDRHDARIRQAATENEIQRVWKEFQEKTVSIKLHKKTWQLAHPVQTYLFIGTDKSGNEDAEGEEYHGSMADALMLIVVDEEEKTYYQVDCIRCCFDRDSGFGSCCRDVFLPPRADRGYHQQFQANR